MAIRPSQVEAARLRVRMLQDRGATPDVRLLALANYVVPRETKPTDATTAATLHELYGREIYGLMGAVTPSVVDLTERRFAREARESAARHIVDDSLSESLNETAFAAGEQTNHSSAIGAHAAGT